VAPALITGITTASGQKLMDSFSMVPMISHAGLTFTQDGLVYLGHGNLVIGQNALQVALDLATGSPGMMRQLTLARASWGSAFTACPPSSIVATQVVRSCAL